MERLNTNPPSSPLKLFTRKKLQSFLQCAMATIQKGVSKSKLALDLRHLIIKRGKDLVMTQRHIITSSSPGCRPDSASFLSPISCGAGHVDVRLSYVSPRDYQFSCCSNSPDSSARRLRRRRRPVKQFHYDGSRRRGSYDRSQYCYGYYRPATSPAGYGGVGDQVAESCAASTVEGCSALSPASWVREVRITDSPFSSMRGGAGGGADGEGHVDGEAERFIQKFYTDLRLEKWMAGHSGIY